MKKTRALVFETNSSSTHSISISSNIGGILDTIVPNGQGSIILTGGRFGWDWQKFNDALTKANYCAVDALYNVERLHMLAEVLTEHTGAKRIVFSIDGDSYIDHESVGTSADAFESPQSLKDFIFNPSSWLFTGNDNEDEHPNFYDVEENIIYTYELKMDGVDFTVKFKDNPSPSELEEALPYVGRKHPMTYRRLYDEFEDEEEYYNYKPYDWYSYERKLVDGTTICSLSKIDKNIVTFYKIEPVYEYDPFEVSKYNPDGRVDKGDKLIEAVDVNFKVIPIS